MGYHDLAHIGDLNGDYFITIGCSFTKGSYLAYNDTWSYKLGKLLQMQHINLAFDGSSIEYQYEVIRKIRALGIDKKIFWMQTHPTRSHRWRLAPFIGDRLARTTDTAWDTPTSWMRLFDHYNLVKEQNVFLTNSWLYSSKIQLLLKEKICKKDPIYFFNEHQPIDFGDDGVHPGAESHSMLANAWYDHLTKHFGKTVYNK